MPTRNVVLTDHQSALIDRLVESGRYQNASEAMREGLRLVEEREEQFQRLRDRLDDARRDLEEGCFSEGSGPDAVRRAFATARARAGHDAAE